jgi:hypothetical protein
MTTVVDKEDTRDWAAGCNGEGQERTVRDGGDSGVVMMAVAAEDWGVGQQQRRQTTTAVDNNVMQDWATD